MSLEVPVLQVAVLEGEAFLLPLAPLLVVKVDVGALAGEKVAVSGQRALFSEPWRCQALTLCLLTVPLHFPTTREEAEGGAEVTRQSRAEATHVCEVPLPLSPAQVPGMVCPGTAPPPPRPTPNTRREMDRAMCGYWCRVGGAFWRSDAWEETD